MKTIAIIEDDQTIGDLLEEVLQKEGYQVERAYSGTEAVYLLSQQRPDLALLDLMLPGLSGEEVLPHLAGVPVIVVSAKVGVDDKVRLLLGGAADYLTKPFELPELLARIQVQLRKGASPLSPVHGAHFPFVGRGPCAAGRGRGTGHRQPPSHRKWRGSPPDQDGIRHFEAAAAKSRAGGGKVRDFGAHQPGHAGLHGILPEAAREQPAEKAAGGRGQGVHPGGVGHWVPAGRGGRGKILTESLPFS